MQTQAHAGGNWELHLPVHSPLVSGIAMSSGSSKARLLDPGSSRFPSSATKRPSTSAFTPTLQVYTALVGQSS